MGSGFIYFSFTALLLFASFVMVLLVLIQRGRGGGLAGAFGGMGGQSAFGTRAGDVFTKITVGVAIVWVLSAGILGISMRSRAEEMRTGTKDYVAPAGATEDAAPVMKAGEEGEAPASSTSGAAPDTEAEATAPADTTAPAEATSAAETSNAATPNAEAEEADAAAPDSSTPDADAASPETEDAADADGDATPESVEPNNDSDQ